MLNFRYHILLTVMTSLATVTSVSAMEYDQGKNINEVFISLQLTNASLPEAFTLIEEKTSFRFHYSEDDIDKNLKFNKTFTDRSVADILRNISRDAHLRFRQINEDISVCKLKFKHRHDAVVKIEQPKSVLELHISDEYDQPLPGVNVMIDGTAKGGITDARGNLKLLVPEQAKIMVSYIGYESTELYVGDRKQVNLQLHLAESKLDEVVVIGSRNLNRTMLETSAPVDVLYIEELIKDLPQLEVGQILNYITPSFSSNRQTIADGTDHVDPASLRGLGVDHVLVLINGKRRHSSALVNVNGSVGRGSVGTDLNAIPAAAIERIEVLRDGAAAQYGSDAIAGVINIVLRDDIDKLYFSATTGQTYEGDGESVQLNTNYGLKVGENGYINLTGQFQYRGATDRAGAWDGHVFKTSWDGSSNSIFSENFQAGDFSPLEPGKKLTDEEAQNLNEANYYTNHLTPDEEEALINVHGGRRAFSMKTGQAQVTNAAFMLNSTFEIDYNKEFYLFGSLNSRNGLSTGFYRLPNQDRNLNQVYPLGFLPEIRSNIFDASMTGGLRGSVNHWHIDFSNTIGINSFLYGVSNSLNASLGSQTPTSFDAGGFKFTQNTTNLDFSRYFKGFMAGSNLAFGAEYRIESYEIIAGEESSYKNYGFTPLIDSLVDGTPITDQFSQVNIFYNRPGGAQVFPGYKPENAYKRSRSNVALYTDWEVSINKDLLLETAIRFENYSDFGNTFNWKVAGLWSVSPRIAIRGAASTGFRAPSLPQRYYNSTSTMFNLNDEGVNVPQEVGTFSNDSPIAQHFGIPNLSNESSLNFSTGMTWKITDKLNFTLDGYSICIYDRVILTGSYSASSSREIADILQRSNAESATFFVNAIDTKTEGIDLILTHENKLYSGILKSSLAANFTSTSVTDVTIPSTLRAAQEQFFNREERNRFEDAVPQSKINLTVNYKIQRFNITLSNVRFGEVWVKTDLKDNKGEYLDQKFSAKVITDLSIGFKATDHLTVTLGANNLLDVYPDKNREEFRSNNQFIYSRRASQFGFNGGFYFARLNFIL